MNRQLAAAAALAVVLSASTLAPAVAKDAKDAKPSPTASSFGDMRKSSRALEQQMLREAMAVWKASMKAYKLAATARDKAMRVINDAFAKSVQRAKADFAQALARSKAAADQAAATARLRDAIDLATATRQAAIDALPAMPAPPGPAPTAKTLQRSPSASPTPVA